MALYSTLWAVYNKYNKNASWVSPLYSIFHPLLSNLLFCLCFFKLFPEYILGYFCDAIHQDWATCFLFKSNSSQQNYLLEVASYVKANAKGNRTPLCSLSQILFFTSSLFWRRSFRSFPPLNHSTLQTAGARSLYSSLTEGFWKRPRVAGGPVCLSSNNVVLTKKSGMWTPCHFWFLFDRSYFLFSNPIPFARESIIQQIRITFNHNGKVLRFSHLLSSAADKWYFS